MSLSFVIKSLWLWGVLFSLGMSFYTMAYLQQFEIVKNPDGIPVLEE